MALREKLHLGLVMAAAAILAVVHSLLRFRNFEAKGYDLGIFDQAVRQYALFNAPIVPIKGEDFHLLGDHFHPIIALFAPLYWIWDDPRMLNLGMIALLVSAAIPVYLVVRGWFSHWPALLASAALVFSWPFQAIVNWDFHEVAFGVPIIAWVIWAIERRRFWFSVGLAALLLLVREDMGATVLAVALVLGIRRAWKPAVCTALLGVFGLVIAVGVVIPHFSPAGEFSYWEYTALGPTAGAALVFLLTQPWNAVVVLFDHPLKLALWAMHLAPLWLLPLLSPYVLLAAPILLSRLFNDRLNVWALVYQYDAILAPIFLLAAMDVVRRIVHQRRVVLLPGKDYQATAAENADDPKEPARVTAPSRLNHLAWAVPSTALAVTLIGSLFFPQLFPYQRTLTGDNWGMSERAEAHQRAVETIPDGVCVEATDTAVPHLVNRTSVGLNGTTSEHRLQWLIIDDRVQELGGSNPLTPDQAFERAEELGFETVTADDEGLWVLYRQTGNSQECAQYLQR